MQVHVGERIGAYCERRGMSQDALAGLIGMSRSWLSQVERGIRGVDRLSTLNDLATVLRIDVADLIGRDWILAPDAPEQLTAVDAVRSQLAGYHHLLGEPTTPWPLPQLRNGAVQVNQAYQAANYQKATAMLPGLIEAADAYDGYQGRDGRETHLARCSVYSAAAKLLWPPRRGRQASRAGASCARRPRPARRARPCPPVPRRPRSSTLSTRQCEPAARVEDGPRARRFPMLTMRSDFDFVPGTATCTATASTSRHRRSPHCPSYQRQSPAERGLLSN